MVDRYRLRIELKHTIGVIAKSQKVQNPNLEKDTIYVNWNKYQPLKKLLLQPTRNPSSFEFHNPRFYCDIRSTFTQIFAETILIYIGNSIDEDGS